MAACVKPIRRRRPFRPSASGARPYLLRHHHGGARSACRWIKRPVRKIVLLAREGGIGYHLPSERRTAACTSGLPQCAVQAAPACSALALPGAEVVS